MCGRSEPVSPFSHLTMARLLLPVFCLALASASSIPHKSTEISRRDATGDYKCVGSNMCIGAVLNGSTVQYTLTGTGVRTVGWMGMGFGSQMSNTPMVIMWGNSDGSVTLSQRQAPSEIQPTLVSDPPRVATLSTTLSTTSGNSAFVYTIPANGATTQNLIYGFGTTNPDSSDPSATLQQHVDYGFVVLDLSQSLTGSTTAGTTAAASSTSTSTSKSGYSNSGSASSGPTDDIPLTPYQRMVVAHAIFCVVGFALLLPAGALLARYLRTFTPTWYTGHWIAQFAIAGPAILIGIVLGFQASGSIGAKILDKHKECGIILFALYLVQCGLGAFIHYVKPKNSTRRPPQNYFHAVLGLTIIALSMYQIRTGYNEEWPNFTGLGTVPEGIHTVWLLWSILLPVLYAAGLWFLPKQYKQEDAHRKGWMDNSNSYGMMQSTTNLRGEMYHDQ
ncbi:hypothetical protein DFH07DRAFT_790896 [Mycena maculata]|uniref:CBD9-like protein n=1 Tax=Mycena maculata TaxID=230809 RepID=A0AAD7NZT3_9AGAR|nr:hypothetical protein DFH07DRAFT_790896 [Mycena maculata]